MQPIPFSLDSLLTLAEVQKLTRVSSTTIYRWIDEGSFPPPVKAGRLSRWRASEVAAFIDGLSAANELIDRQY